MRDETDVDNSQFESIEWVIYDFVTYYLTGQLHETDRKTKIANFKRRLLYPYMSVDILMKTSAYA